MNQLYKYCMEGDINKLKLLLNENPNINIHESNDWPFMICCVYEHIDIIKFIINISEKYSGRKIYIHGHDDYAFRYSCTRGNIDIAHLLIKISIKYSYKLININYFGTSDFYSTKVYQFMQSIGNYIDTMKYNMIIL